MAEDYQLTVDRSAIFTLREAVTVEAALLGEFVEKVGIMTVHPYLREGIFTLATNLGVDTPVMGLMRAGSVKLTLDLRPADWAEQSRPDQYSAGVHVYRFIYSMM